MKRIIGSVLLAMLIAGETLAAESIKLPAPATSGGMAINQAIQTRRSVRSYKPDAMSLQEVSQLLWSAQGITDPKTGHRAAPSAVASYPLKLYMVVRPEGVTGLDAGVYLYEPKDHSIEVVKKGDSYAELIKDTAFFNKWMKDTDVTFIFGGKPGLLQKMGDMGPLYMHLEAGMAAENLGLESVSLGLGRCTVGGFTEKKVAATLGIEKDVEVLLLVPVGKTGASSE
jgi:SagB-type dehydrogenase family enzyme